MMGPHFGEKSGVVTSTCALQSHHAGNMFDPSRPDTLVMGVEEGNLSR